MTTAVADTVRRIGLPLEHSRWCGILNSVRNQTDRDEQTLMITSGLGVFVVVVLFGIVALWLTNSLVELHDGFMTWAFLGVIGVAVGVAVGYLRRNARAGSPRS